MVKIREVIMIYLLIASFALSGVTAGVYPDIEGESASDKAIIDMFHLGFLPDEPTMNFRPDDVITRGEFAEWLVKIGGQMLNATTVGDVFTDVEESHLNYSDIQTLVAYGIMKGYGNGVFGADRTLLCEEGLKSVLVLLGYRDYAEAKGGYPVGYLTVGSEKGLTRNLSFRAGKEMTRREAANMLYRALSVSVMDITGVTDSNVNYGTDKNLLYAAHKLIKQKGRVTVTEVSSLPYGEEGTKGMLLIDGVTYRDGTGNGKDLLGHAVEFYYEDEDSEIKTIVYIKNDDNTKMQEINSRDIVSFEGNVLEVKSGKKYRLSGNADVIYNGKVTDYSKNDITFRNADGSWSGYGTVTLIDNTGNGQYDLVDVRAWHNVIVNSVQEGMDKEGKAIPGMFNIYGMNGDVLRIDESINYTLKSTEGYNILHTGLLKFDVLSVMESKDGKNMTIVYSSKVVTGTVESISEEEKGIYTIEIDGVLYEVCRGFGYYSVDQTETDIGITPGNKAFFGLDIHGNIAVVNDKSKNDGYTYGLFIDYKPAKGLGGEADIKVLQANGNIVIMKTAAKVSIDEKRMAGATEIVNILLDAAGEYNGTEAGVPLRREVLVKYAVDNTGLINRINIPYKGEPKPSESEHSVHVMPPTENKSTVRLQNNSEFGAKIVSGIDTIFFYQPPADEPITDEDYCVLSTDMLHGGEEHEIRAFSSNLNSQTAEALVIYRCNIKYSKNEVKINEKTPASVYLRKAVGVDANGESRTKMYFSQMGREMSVTVSNAALGSFLRLTPGDAFRYGIDKDGNADKIDIIYKFDQNKLLREGAGTIRGNGQPVVDWLQARITRATFGAVYGSEDTTMAYINQSESQGVYIEDPFWVDLNILTEQQRGLITRRDMKRWQMCRYDAESNTVSAVSTSEIRAYQQSPGEYDYALVLMYEPSPFMVIFYKSSDMNWQ